MGAKVKDPDLIKKLRAMREEAAAQNTPSPDVDERGRVVNQDLIEQLKKAQNNEFDFGRMVGNIPSSAAQFAKDVVHPFIHPVDTAKALANVGMGYGEKLTEGVQQHEQYADQMNEFFKGRYGSMDALKKTTMEDPVGILADAATVATAGGAGVSRLPGMAGRAGRMAMSAGAAIDPLNLLKNAGKTGAAFMTPRHLPRELYQRAAKFSTTLPVEQRNRITDTLLDYNIPPTQAGVDMVNGRISRLSDDLDNLINAAEESGARVHRSTVLRHVNEVWRELAGSPKLRGADNAAQISEIVQNFMDHMDNLNRDYITVKELHEFKKDIYKTLDYDAKNSRSTLARDETEKAIARAAKEGVEQFVPEAQGINAEMGRLLETLRDSKGNPILERTAARIDNRNPLPFFTPTNTVAGGAIGGAPGAAAGFGMSMASMPRSLYGAALNMANWRRMGPAGIALDNSIPLTMGRQALFQGGRAGNGILDYEDL